MTSFSSLATTTTASTTTIPGWTILLAGVLIGQYGSLTNSSVSIIDAWNSFLTLVVVPIYTICVLLYLGRIAAAIYLDDDNGLTKYKKGELSVPPPPSVATTVSDTSTTAIVDNVVVVDDDDDDDGVVNMTGSYLLISNEGFERFLEVQGVPWALRRTVNQIRPVHQITHTGRTVTIQIKGFIESQTTYQIDGPPVETNVRGRIFRDQMTYLESGDGIRVSKTAVTENYDITVIRRLSPNKQTINMTSTASFHDGRPPIESRQVFQRIG